jgi:micrococcal nuclease
MNSKVFWGAGVLVVLLSALGLFSLRKNQFVVTKVVDGDTIRLSNDQTIRYIGIDTPEMAGNECFCQEAKKMNEQLVSGKKVRLIYGKNEMDQYGRWLAFVFVTGESGQELMVNETLLGQGAGEYFMDTIKNMRKN